MICINKSLLSFMKLKITTNAVSFPNCLQFILAVASRLKVRICLLNSPWTDGYKIVGFVRETARRETLFASCLLLWMFTFDNFVKKWKADETCVNLVAVHTGSCNVGCAPSFLCAAKNGVFNPSLGEVPGRFVVGSKMEIKDLFILFLFFFFFFFLSPFFHCLVFGGSLWTKRPSKFCPRFCLLKCGLCFSTEVLFGPNSRHKSVFRRGRCLEIGREHFCEPIVSLVSQSNLLLSKKWQSSSLLQRTSSL